MPPTSRSTCWAFIFAEASRVAYIGRVGGILVGILVAVLFLLTGYIESTRDEQNLLEILKIQE